MQFGTDGIRGVADVDVTPELAVALGRAAARALAVDRFVVGRDTRLSGPMIQAALAAGMASEGAAVVDLGVLPTPGVAHMCWSRDVAGAVVSASHNPYGDNGVKIFGVGGAKLDDAAEERIETELRTILESPRGGPPRRGGESVGRLTTDADGGDIYLEHLETALSDRRLDGLSIVLDCANGAASELAPRLFRGLGADVAVLFDRPDGVNINAGCGSTHPDALREAVRDEGATLGLAFDGDADRVLAVDEEGNVVDGDQIMAMLAIDMQASGALAGDTLVVTVMSNLGLRIAMRERGIQVVETPVGDRHVLEALSRGGWSLGGEQSGHLIFPKHATTGDGLLTGMLLADLVARRSELLSTVAGEAMTRLPQALQNVRVRDVAALETANAVWDEVRRVERELGDAGRVLLRASGTEPLIRVMAEAPTEEAATATVTRLCQVVSEHLGASGS